MDFVPVGKLDRCIEFHRLTIGRDNNAPSRTYTKEFEAWAYKEHKSGSEQVSVGSDTNFSTVEFEIHYRDELLGVYPNREAYRIVDENEIYNIIEVRELGRKRRHRIVAEKWTEETSSAT